MGRDYTCPLTRQGEGELLRLVIADLRHYPDIGRTPFTIDVCVSCEFGRALVIPAAQSSLAPSPHGRAGS